MMSRHQKDELGPARQFHHSVGNGFEQAGVSSYCIAVDMGALLEKVENHGRMEIQELTSVVLKLRARY